jgi:ParB family chromosome partitioning protein
MGAKLKPLGDFFDTLDEQNGIEKAEITNVPLSELFPFKNHPYKIIDNSDMKELVQSIKQSGIIIPGIVRARKTGGYEILAGHRRKHASELAGLETMPVFIRDADEIEAELIVIYTNKQRTDLLPSEKAFAYKMELDALRRKAGRPAGNSAPVVLNFTGQQSRDILGDSKGDSGKQVSRYIRLTELISALLDKVDSKFIAFRPAVELSYLKPEEQEIIDQMDAKPSLKQAEELKKLSLESTLTEEAIQRVLTVEKKPKEAIQHSKIKKYFPKGYTAEQMEEVIVAFLKNWAKENR